MKRGAWRIALGLTVLLVLVFFLDVRQVQQVLMAMDGRWVLVAIGLILTNTMLGAISLHLLLNAEGRLPFSNFLPMYWTSWAVGQVFPGQVGDMASMTALLQRRGFAPEDTLGRCMADKLVSLLLMVGFALWAMRQQVSGLLFLAAMAVLLAMGVWMLRYLGAGHRPAAAGAVARVIWFVSRALTESMNVIRAFPQRVAVNMALTALKICLTGLAYWSIFHASGFATPGWEVVTLVAVSSLVAYIPVSLNGIGTAEAAGVALFSSVGVGPPAVLASYIVLRAIGLSLAWIPAGAWMMWHRTAR